MLFRSLGSDIPPSLLGDPENVGGSLVGSDGRYESLPLLEVSKMADPVGACLSRARDVPLHRGVAMLVCSLQPVEPGGEERRDRKHLTLQTSTPSPLPSLASPPPPSPPPSPLTHPAPL